MTSVIIASLIAAPLAAGTTAPDRAIHPYQLSSATEKDGPVDISQRFKRAQKGDAASQLIVGRKYLELQNFARALYWFEKSAGKGNIEAQIHLGDAYARGKVVSVDLVKAHRWLSLAAAKGGYEAKFRLQYLLSKMIIECCSVMDVAI